MYCGFWVGASPLPHLSISSVVNLILAAEDHHLPTNAISTVTCCYPDQGYLGKPCLWVGCSWYLPMADCYQKEVECYTNPTLYISPGRQAADLESTYGWCGHFPQNRSQSQDGCLASRYQGETAGLLDLLVSWKGQNMAFITQTCYLLVCIVDFTMFAHCSCCTWSGVPLNLDLTGEDERI